MELKQINNRWRYRRWITIIATFFLFLLETIAVAKFTTLPFNQLTIQHVIFFAIATLSLLAIILVYFIASTFDDVKGLLVAKLKDK